MVCVMRPLQIKCNDGISSVAAISLGITDDDKLITRTAASYLSTRMSFLVIQTIGVVCT